MSRASSRELSEWMAYFKIKHDKEELEMEVAQKAAEAKAKARKEAGG